MSDAGDAPGRAAAPTASLHYARRVIVFADVVESVRLMQRDELASAQRIRALLVIAAQEIIPAHEGQLLQRLGDGLMIAFTDARSAAACAAALHERAAEQARGVAPADRVALRIGIHAADVLTDDVAFYGHGVNLASRVATLAGPGETVISAALRGELTSGIDGDIVDLGECHLKHIEAPLRAYRLGSRTALPPMIDSQIALRPTVAVIPFTFHGGGPPFLAVGEIIADEVIASLSRSPELRVVSRLSTTAFRDRNARMGDIRAFLGATYVLTGAYRVSGDALIVGVELADARNSEIVWAETLRGRVDGLVAQDDDVVAAIVRGVGNAVMNSEVVRTKSRALPTLDAYTLLLGGVGLMHRSDPRDFDKSRQAFEQLIERYPRFSAPYAYLAEWHVFKVTQGWFTSLEREAVAALDYAKRALDVDTPDSHELTAYGLVHTNLLREHDVARESYDRALEKNPNQGLAWLHRGVLSAFQGRGAEAVEETGRAVGLSPLDPWRYYYDSLCATAALAAKDYQSAITLAERSLSGNRLHASTLRVIAIASAELGLMEDAHEAVAELRKLDPSLTVTGYRTRSAARNYETGARWADALARAGLPP
jgi:class 3 adenylate cyclase/TolB-like protein